MPPETQAALVVKARHPGDCLDSWKGIASYVRVSVATAQRWEKSENLPVHRHMHRKQGSVYAYAVEIDRWLESREVPPDLREPISPEGRCL
ncbi:hypothetical protein [Geothrix sp. 21YS21S-2]|uniref:hypothetical protein n=1 Tax=Geothrix sp. 21YS21S-2 TaxID=3068893 RepID=UPI0027BADC66|nr:hypothetical protein [Geothrix sp. 21YS21S-2]